ncbi:hypothetical protein [Streptomyces sulfonofaciens]|uniref:hypothetical protein n=1 Tax=Streptomyces sulfonofaciens TaxID=68272 RepID=UPI00167282BE|nr:hypothetical protein [Streptomyces sulfonofaciens]
MIRDGDLTAHRSAVLIQPLSDEQWDRFLGVAAESSGHIAALLEHGRVRGRDQ